MNTLFLIISIDTEESYTNTPRMIECDFGEQGSCGVNYIMQELEKRQMRGCFFTALYGHEKYTGEYDGYMEKLLQRIHGRGHEIGLHTHPYHGKNSSFPIGLHRLDFAAQKKVLSEGMEFIYDATGRFPIAHRGGAYSCNEETFQALAELGFRVDSSVYYGTNDSVLNGFPSYFTINQTRMHQGILEVPVINFFNEKGELTKFDPNSMTEGEFVAVLEAMKQRGDFPVAQMMLHSFSFLDQQWKADRPGKKPVYVAGAHHVYGINRNIMAKFEHILDYLTADSGVQVVTFEEYLSLRQPAPSFWGEGIFSANSDAAKTAARDFRAIRTNHKAAVQEAYHAEEHQDELAFDTLPPWGRRTYYGDSEIPKIADEILSGTMHVYPKIEGLPYQLNSFDWGKQHSRIAATFQLYLQALNPVIVLARAYELTRKRAYLAYGVKLIRSWKQYRQRTPQSKNRYLFNDHSVALRANNLMYFGKACNDAGFWNRGLDALLGGIIKECGAWLFDDRHYTRNHNHGIMQDEALLHVGRLLRRMEYIRHAKERLKEQWENAFNVEGVHQENSPEYHSIVSTLFTHVADYLSRLGDQEGAMLRKKLEPTKAYAAWCRLPNGFRAQFGDTNSIPGRKYAEKSLQAREMTQSSICYPDARMYFYRSSQDADPKDDTWKMFKCGYQRLTHKHADDGSFMLYSKGYEIFTDGGIYGYTNDDFRKYFVSALAHNVVVVDGASYPLTAENAAKAGFSGFRQKGNVDYVRSFHRAYDGVVWERDFVSADDLTILRDCLISKSRHEYAQVFHLGEDIRVLSADHQEVLLQLADTGYHVRLRQYGEPAELEVVRSDLQHPGYGMMSRGENHIEASTDLVFRCKDRCATFLTVITIENDEGMVRLFDQEASVSDMEYDLDADSIALGDVKVSLDDFEENLKPDMEPENDAVVPEKEAVGALQVHSDPMENFPWDIYWSQVYHDTIIGSKWLLDAAISPGGPYRWAAGYNLLYPLYRILNEFHPMHILELGLGQSTKLTAQYTRDFHARHLVVEHDREWAEFFRKGWPQVTESGTLLCITDLQKESYQGAEYVSYQHFEQIPSLMGHTAELILIDGPFGGNGEWARRDIVKLLPEFLSPDFAILVDDCGRKGEQNLVKELKSILRRHKIAFAEGKYQAGAGQYVQVLASASWKFATTL